MTSVVANAERRQNTLAVIQHERRTLGGHHLPCSGLFEESPFTANCSMVVWLSSTV